MTNELITGEGAALITDVQRHGIEEIVKPLTQEIHLFDTRVAGTTHLEDETVLDSVAIGEKLQLRREANKFDENAILILTEEGRKLGYVPEKDNVVFARLMDAGKKLIARVNQHDLKGSFHQITVGIYLVDF